jgi:phospholipid/cholesterol/gamma-HCH transport system substrate-binding protein
MASRRFVETLTGFFLLAAIAAFLILAFRVSGLTGLFRTQGYTVTAAFDEIGQLKVRSAVRIDGVNIGEVTRIQLDPVTFRALVSMRINQDMNHVPDDSSASILTAGLLGDNYVSITPMYSQTFLKNGSQIEETHSAMILERLIGQFLFNINKKGKS